MMMRLLLGNNHFVAVQNSLVNVATAGRLVVVGISRRDGLGTLVVTSVRVVDICRSGYSLSVTVLLSVDKLSEHRLDSFQSGLHGPRCSFELVNGSSGTFGQKIRQTRTSDGECPCVGSGPGILFHICDSSAGRDGNGAWGFSVGLGT